MDVQNDLCQITNFGREARVPANALLCFMAFNSVREDIHNIPAVREGCPVVHAKTHWLYGNVTIWIKKNEKVENYFLLIQL
jgi:hypothetical protein